MSADEMSVPYAELHAHSAYSFADGASTPDELAAAAAELGYEALALTDHDGLWGSMEHAHACHGFGIRPITGCELTVAGPGDGPIAHLTLLVESWGGYRNLCRLLTAAHRDTRPRPGREPLQPAVTLAEIIAHSEGLACLSGCARDGLLAAAIDRDQHCEALELGGRLRDAFGGDGFYVELQRPYWRHDRWRNRRLAALAEELGVGCVATGNVHCHHLRRAPLQDALVAVREHATLEACEPARRGNRSSALASPQQMAARFHDHPEAVRGALELAERLRFDLTTDLGYRYPGSEDPTADARLAEVCRGRFGERYDGTPRRSEAERRLDEELAVIRKLGLSGFFLLHRDLLELAREVAVEVRGPESARALLPPGRGRGSSVSSIVCYLTGLSHVDPVEAGLFLGRFLNDEITEAPDIDLDFPRDVREILIPRIHERYGAEHSALVAAFPTYRARGAVRDLGKALGLPPGEIERVAKACDVYLTASPPGSPAAGPLETGPGDPREQWLEAAPLYGYVEEAIGAERARSRRWRALVALAAEAQGLPRHVSQHPGGMVLSTRPLIDLCPVQPAAMEGRQMVQWDKDSCADAGFLKIDLLGLGMLSAVERCVEEIGRVRGERIDLSRIPLDDTEAYAAIRRAETTGVFQIESRAQMQMLPRSLPENLDDLTVQVALVRPGPIQGGAVHPYLERRKQLREDPAYRVPYDHPDLEPILADTLGAIVFQDQVIQVAMALAGFSAGEAEGLRRAMSRKRSEEALRAYRERFVSGAIGRGIDRALAERIFEQVQGFSGFGFPKSHAAAFGLLAYQSTWLRVHYGPEFLAALLNEQPMGFYPPDTLVHEAQRRDTEVLAPDVLASAVECRVEAGGDGFAVRIGLGYVDGLAAEDAEAAVAERQANGPYRSIGELAARTGLGRGALERLAWAGALASLAREPARAVSDLEAPDRRRSALWAAGTVARARSEGGELQLPLPLTEPKSPPLPELDRWQRVRADYDATQISLGTHPMELLREGLEPEVLSSKDLSGAGDGSTVEIAGMVVARQRPATAKGIMFMLLEDEHGVINLVIPPPVYRANRLVARTAPFLRGSGRLEDREGTLNVVMAELRTVQRPGLPVAPVRTIEPPAGRETGRVTKAPPAGGAGDGGAIADLAAALPAGHSFGRRGR